MFIVILEKFSAETDLNISIPEEYYQSWEIVNFNRCNRSSKTLAKSKPKVVSSSRKNESCFVNTDVILIDDKILSLYEFNEFSNSLTSDIKFLQKNKISNIDFKMIIYGIDFEEDNEENNYKKLSKTTYDKVFGDELNESADEGGGQISEGLISEEETYKEKESKFVKSIKSRISCARTLTESLGYFPTTYLSEASNSGSGFVFPTANAFKNSNLGVSAFGGNNESAVDFRSITAAYCPF